VKASCQGIGYKFFGGVGRYSTALGFEEGAAMVNISFLAIWNSSIHEEYMLASFKKENKASTRRFKLSGWGLWAQGCSVKMFLAFAIQYSLCLAYTILAFAPRPYDNLADEGVVMDGLTRHDKSSKKLNKIFFTILTTWVANTQISY
jgi:hypothetical protein